MAPRRAMRGFTLLEILVALVVLAVALGALIKAGSEHARNTAYLQDRALAGWVAANVLADYEAGLKPPDSGGESTRETLAGHEWEARVEIREQDFDAPLELPAILRIDVEVRAVERPGDHPAAQVTGYALP